MEKIIDKILSSSTNFIINLICAILIIVIGLKLVSIIEKSLKKEHRLTKFDVSVKGFIISVVSISLKILVFVSAATILGVPTTSMVTLIGSSALAIGLALQGGLSNLAGGLMILMFKPFKVGDYIESNQNEGTVKNISMFYTTLTTNDNKDVMLPNGNLTNSSVVNYTANKKRRIDLNISVSYDSNIEKVKKVINNIISKHDKILKDEANDVRLCEHADSALIFTVRAWTKTEDYLSVKFDLLEEIKEAFDKNKIEIPFPQLDVHNKK